MSKKPKVQILMPSEPWKQPVEPKGKPTYAERVAFIDAILVRLPKVAR